MAKMAKNGFKNGKIGKKRQKMVFKNGKNGKKWQKNGKIKMSKNGKNGKIKMAKNGKIKLHFLKNPQSAEKSK